MGEAFFVGWYGSFIMNKMKHAELLIVMIPFFISDFLHATHFSLEANFIQQIMALATANHLFYNYLSKRTIRSRRHNLDAFSPAKNTLSELLRVTKSHLKFVDFKCLGCQFKKLGCIAK